MEPVKLSRISNVNIPDCKVITEKKCIICDIADDGVITTENGRTKIRVAAAIRKDHVSQKLARLENDAVFYYHITNDCYKRYCHKRALELCKENEAAADKMFRLEGSKDHSSEDTRQSSRNRSRRTIAGSTASMRECLCVICNCKTHNRTYNKYRISEYSRAQRFLEATVFFQDNVFLRTCDLQDVSSVFGADLMCHDDCITNYILRYEREQEKDVKAKRFKKTQKDTLFASVVQEVETGLNNSYGYTLSYIRDKLNVEADLKFSNRELKLRLCGYFGESITFSKSIQQNKPEMFFSSKLSVLQVAEVVRSCNPITECASILRDSLQNMNYDLKDKYCDAQNLQQSWRNAEVPNAFVQFFSTLFDIDPSEIEFVPGEVLGDCIETDNNEEHDSAWKVKAQSVLQIMYYMMHRGRKKTPLHVMNGLAIHERCRSKTLITSFNHLGLTVSYDDVLRHHNDMALYTVLNSGNRVPLPSHFSPDMYTIAAFDNFDHEEASLSGIGGSHDTVCVLFQEKPPIFKVKPLLSESGVKHGPKTLQHTLPCQDLQHYIKPSKRPDLPEDYKVEPDKYTMNIDTLKRYETTDKVWQFSRIAHTATTNLMTSHEVQQLTPSWSAFNALVSEETLHVKQVGFLPVIPHPVTKHATVFTALCNFKGVLSQLKQDFLPIFCDEGVYCIAREILLNNPELFKHLLAMIGPFHMAKVLLGCTGKYLKGSGASDIFIECSVFGVNVTESVLSGINYVRSVSGMQMLAETMFRLQVMSFFKEYDVDTYKEEMQELMKLQKRIAEGKSLLEEDFYNEIKIDKLINDFEAFIDRGRKISEQFLYWDNFLRLVSLLRKLIRSDREGLWDLHLDTVQKLLPVFVVFDCINYQRWCSLYLEDMRRLQDTAPEVHAAFMKGEHVVKRYQHKFTAVGVDMALEQTINRSQKSSSGIIGDTKRKQFVAQWELTYHEVLMIANLYRQVTNSITTRADLHIHHEFSPKQTERMDKLVVSMTEYVSSKGNPFDKGVPTSLHNLITKEVVSDDAKKKLLDIWKLGDDLYDTFRKERYIDKTTRISAVIHKTMMPTFATKHVKKGESKKGKARGKNLQGAAYRMIQIAQLRGYEMEELFRYELSENSILFDEHGRFSKTQKGTLMKELESDKSYETESMSFKPDNSTCYIFDVMNSSRKLVTKEKVTFGDVASAYLSYTTAIAGDAGRIDHVFDSYMVPSPKDSERSHRKGNAVIELGVVSPDVRLPIQMDTFWPSSENKLRLQKLLAESVIKTYTDNPCNSIHMLSAFSGSTEDVAMECISIRNGAQETHPELHYLSTEEADFRMMIHAKHAAEHDSAKIVFVSSDTDIMVLSLFHWNSFHSLGVQELWLRSGVGDSTRLIPIHLLAANLGPEVCSILPAAHALSGADYTSKFGTKKAALACKPIEYLKDFGLPANDFVMEKSMKRAEEYLVQLLRKSSSCKTLDELRVWLYHHGKNITVDDLPPTSRAAKGHLLRSYYHTHMQIHCMDETMTQLDPQLFGFEASNSMLMPSRYIIQFPSDFIGACKCLKCATKACPCRTAKVSCCSFCKCYSVDSTPIQCKNPYN